MTTLTTLAIAVVGAIVLVVADLLFGSNPDLLDTEGQERWLARHAPDALQPMLRHIDRRVAGGIMVAASFAAVLSGAVAVGLVFDSIYGNRASLDGTGRPLSGAPTTPRRRPPG